MSSSSDPPDPSTTANDESMEVLAHVLTQDAVQTVAQHEHAKTEKKKQATKRKSNSGKIETIYEDVDLLAQCSSHLKEQHTYMESMEPDLGDPIKMRRHIQQLMKSNYLLQQAIDSKTKSISQAANNTAGKKRAKAAHAKVTKQKKQEERDAMMQRSVLMKGANSFKVFTESMKQLKSGTASNVSKSVIAEQPLKEAAASSVGDVTVRKRIKLTGKSDNTVDDGAKEKSVPEPSIPRPENGRLMYKPQEAANIGYNLMNDNSFNRAEKKAFKEKMISSGRVPIQYTALNNLIKNHGGPGKPHAKDTWDAKGREEIMPIEDLVAARKAKIEGYTGTGWCQDDTAKVLTARVKSNLEAKGLDASNAKPPSKDTVAAYHTALQEADPTIVERSCNTKAVNRKVAETSERACLANTSAIIGEMFYVQPNVNLIPLSNRFDESRASPGAIRARELYAQAHGVPPRSVHAIDPSMVTNQDDMAAIYGNFNGDGSCSGQPNQKQMMLVDRDAANDPSYNVHNNNKDDSQELNGIKIRATNVISAAGYAASCFIQVLGFTDAEMPPSLVPNGLIVLKIRGLSADGSVNPLSETYGFVVLVRKGANVETEMFKVHTEIVVEPFIDKLRALKKCTDPKNIPRYLQALLSCDGGGTQLNAMCDEESLTRKVERKETQLKLGKNPSTVIQPNDTGRGHCLFRHWIKALTDTDVPSVFIIDGFLEAIQCLRDEGKLVISAKKITCMTKMISRLPTVLHKSFTPTTIYNSFAIPGFTDSSRQCPDLDKLFNTYKGNLTIEKRERWEKILPILIRSYCTKGHFVETAAKDEFRELGVPVDTDENGTEHILPESFETQLTRQRTTTLTNPGVSSRLSGANARIAEQERQRIEIVEETRWRTDELEKNYQYEAKLHKLQGRVADSDRSLLMSDVVNDKLIEFIAKEGGKARSFVRVRSMVSQKDRSFKAPTQDRVGGNVVNLKASLAKTSQQLALDKKEDCWCLRALQLIGSPVVLTAVASPPEEETPAEEPERTSALSRSVFINTHDILQLNQNSFLENPNLVSQLRTCLAECNLQTVCDATYRQSEALVRVLPQRLQALISVLPSTAHHSWAFAAFKDNLYPICQTLALLGQVLRHAEGADAADGCLLAPFRVGQYSLPLSNDDTKSLQGVGLYVDSSSNKFRQAMIAPSFDKKYAADLKNAGTNPPPNNLSRKYPTNLPPNADQGGYNGRFQELEMCAGIMINANRNNKVLTNTDGTGVLHWSNRTMTKLNGLSGQGSIQTRQINLICSMFECAYALMIGSTEYIFDGPVFRQFLGPIKM